MPEHQNINNLVKLLKKLEKLNRRELTKIEPIIREAMAAKVQDLDYLDKLTDVLQDIVFSGFGQKLYDEYLYYIASFNPQRAKEYRGCETGN